MRVLVCPDKFKGSADAQAVARAIKEGWLAVRPEDVVMEFPISDGGDGFGSLLAHSLRLEARRTETVDAAGRPCSSEWWRTADGRLSVIESARTVGLAMLRPGQFHPFELNTAGLGPVLTAASNDSSEMLVGIGGSSTNDGGFGLARSLGWQFFDADRLEITRWTGLQTLAKLTPPAKRPLEHVQVTVAVDVQNPLLGSAGATRVYGPQKGLSVGEFDLAEECLARLADVVRETSGADYANAPGAGAAGGLGFGLMAFAGARACAGFDVFAERSGFHRTLREAQLVITGEGRIDKSTMMGKGVGQVALLCRSAGIPCVGLAGALDPAVEEHGAFSHLDAITSYCSPTEAMADPAFHLRSLASAVAHGWPVNTR